MKKIFTLVLATAMLSSTAFAAPVIGTPATGTTDTALTALANTVTPDSTLFISAENFTLGTSSLSTLNLGEFNSDNFVVGVRKFRKGSNLVKTVTIDNDRCQVAITFHDDLGLKVPNLDNVTIDDINVKAKKDIDSTTAGWKVSRNTTYAFSHDLSGQISGIKLGYTESPQTLGASPVYDLGKISKFSKTAGGPSYDIASASLNELYVEGRVYADDKIFVSMNADADKEILRNPAYADADLRFINVKTNGFSSNNTVQISAEEDEFVYEIVNKALVKTKLTWSEDSYAWVGKTLGSKSYVISDVELKVGETPAVGDGTNAPTNNPETGANDVVGVAAALAVVSLVAAGAVSLKK